MNKEEYKQLKAKFEIIDDEDDILRVISIIPVLTLSALSYFVKLWPYSILVGVMFFIITFILVGRREEPYYKAFETFAQEAIELHP